MGISGLGSVFGGVLRRGLQQIPEIIGSILPLAGGRFGGRGARAEFPSLLRLE